VGGSIRKVGKEVMDKTGMSTGYRERKKAGRLRKTTNSLKEVLKCVRRH
jgi:hypothetical protein